MTTFVDDQEFREWCTQKWDECKDMRFPDRNHQVQLEA